MSKKAIQMNSVQEIFVFVISLTFMFLFRFIPPFGTVTPYGMALLGIFIGVIFGWCFGGNNWGYLLSALQCRVVCSLLVCRCSAVMYLLL